MKSHPSAPTDTEQKLAFSGTEKEQLKKKIKDLLENTNINSSMSVGAFFNNLNLIDSSFSEENKKLWNLQILQEKNNCIAQVRSNATKPPKLDTKQFHVFLLELTVLGLLDLNDSIVSKMNLIHDKAIRLLDHQNQA